MNGLNVAYQAGRNYWTAHRMFPHMREIPAGRLASVASSCGFGAVAECEAWLTGFDDGRRDYLRAIGEVCAAEYRARYPD